MSKRGREFYDGHIASSLCNPDLADLRLESHAENLAGGADDAGIVRSGRGDWTSRPALALAMTKLKP